MIRKTESTRVRVRYHNFDGGWNTVTLTNALEADLVHLRGDEVVSDDPDVVVEMYTGKKDRNGVPIFEGDCVKVYGILRMEDYTDELYEETVVCSVIYHLQDTRFYALDDWGEEFYDISIDMEVCNE